jgi:hypothetical protein
VTTSTQELVPKLTPEQYDLLLFTEQYYWRYGGVPTYAHLTREGIDFPEHVFLEAWANPRFLDGLRGRGIPEHLITPERGALRGKVLTEQQFTVANVMLDVLDKRSRLKKLTELGISTAEYNGWLRDPVYRQYCLERAEELLESNQHVAHMSLIDRVAQGDLGAIKYFNSMTGRYREKNDAGVEVNVTNVSGSDMLIRVVEIIQTHVKDPATLEAIATDILALTGGGANGNGAGKVQVATAVGPLGSQTGQNIITGKVATYGI